MAKTAYIVFRGSVPEFVADNLQTAHNALVSALPLLEKDYCKSYVQAFRDIKLKNGIFECMTPSAYWTIKKFRIMRRKNAKP